MKKLTGIRVIFLMILPLCASVSMGSVTYSGSLTSTADNLGPIQGREDWIDPGATSLSWEVTNNETYWHYKYILTVPLRHEVSHFIIGVSDQFTLANIWNAVGDFAAISIGDFDQANGNPNIPAALHGLKFDGTSGTTLTIEFDSDRRAVWGDFYAKNGANPKNEAWNAGMTVADPLDVPADGSISSHILVPDTYVPEPVTLSLLTVGGLAILRRSRK